MNINHRTFHWNRNARPGGGIWIGVKYQFPIKLYDSDDIPRNSSVINIGLLFWTLTIYIDIKTKP